MKTVWTTAHESERGEKGAVLVVEVGNPENIIARVPPSVGRGDRQTVADLLAGAPEMYEVCKKIVETHDEKWKDSLTGHCFCEECLLLRDVIYICDGGYARDIEDQRKRERKKKRRKR